jgi:uncharacterized membrane protein YhaH (DUF805 family)
MSRSGGMEQIASPFSTAGRIAPRPFALGVTLVYILSFLSQVLISPPATARIGILPFAAVQAALSWAWLAFHAKRLRDAGRPIGPALGIAVLYGLAMGLLMLLVGPVAGAGLGAAPDGPPRASATELWVVLLAFAVFLAPTTPDLFYYVSLGILALILMPIVIAICFSIWAGTRPRASTAAPSQAA